MVSSNRNVLEASVFKFVYENQFIDNIIEVFTPEELFTYLKKFRFEFNTAYIDNGKSKRAHVETLQHYFGDKTIHTIDVYKKNPTLFDKDFMKAIANRLKGNPDE